MRLNNSSHLIIQVTFQWTLVKKFGSSQKFPKKSKILPFLMYFQYQLGWKKGLCVQYTLVYFSTLHVLSYTVALSIPGCQVKVKSQIGL